MIWSLGAGLLQPLFNGGRIKRNYEAAKARFDQALALYQRTALICVQGSRGRAGEHREVRRAAGGIRRGVEALRDGVQLSRSRYDTGLSSYLEVLVADQQLFQQELQLAVRRAASS